jgi:hypothetical protein
MCKKEISSEIDLSSQGEEEVMTYNIDLLEHIEFFRLKMLLYDGSKEELLMNNLLDLMKGKRVTFRLLDEDYKQEAVEIFHKAGYFTATTKIRLMASKYKLN